MNSVQNSKQNQINKFIEELNKSGMSFTAFKAMIAKTRLSEFNLIYSLQTMVTYSSYGNSFTTQQLTPDVYDCVKKQSITNLNPSGFVKI